MRAIETEDGGRHFTADNVAMKVDITLTRAADGQACAIVAPNGQVVGFARIDFRTHPMPPGFDVEQERRRAQQGGCCG